MNNIDNEIPEFPYFIANMRKSEQNSEIRFLKGRIQLPDASSFHMIPPGARRYPWPCGHRRWCPSRRPRPLGCSGLQGPCREALFLQTPILASRVACRCLSGGSFLRILLWFLRIFDLFYCFYSYLHWNSTTFRFILIFTMKFNYFIINGNSCKLSPFQSWGNYFCMSETVLFYVELGLYHLRWDFGSSWDCIILMTAFQSARRRSSRGDDALLPFHPETAGV